MVQQLRLQRSQLAWRQVCTAAAGGRGGAEEAVCRTAPCATESISVPDGPA
jgi:hypothetical protein